MPPLVLASGSPHRLRILQAAGVPVIADPPDEAVEDAAKARLAGLDLPAAALALAEAKARAVAGRHPAALVLGADQIAECDGQVLGKPRTPDQARAQLRQLRGRSHTLVTAVVLVENGENGGNVWTHIARPRLTMRNFSEAFLEAYLAGDPGYLGCAGAYQIEGAGAALFETIEGDFFAIQGLPLLPVLAALRARGVLLV